MKVLVLVIGATIGVTLCAALVRAERRGRPEVGLAVLVVVVLLEAILYQSEHRVPVGLFRLSLAGQSFRLPELVISMVLLSRVLVKGLPQRVTAPGAAWAVFVAWYALQGLLGAMAGNPVNEVIYQLRAVIYLGGGIALASGIPPHRYLSRSFHRRVAWVVGTTVAVFVVFSVPDTSFDVSLPGLPLPGLGIIGADSASIFVVAGLVILLLELGRERRRPTVLLAAVPLLAAPFATNQRGAIVGLALSLAVLFAAAWTGTWHRRRLATVTEITLAVVALGAAALVLQASASDPAEPSPIVAFYDEAFEGVGKQQSADTRVLLWDEAHRLWESSPVIGSGLGAPFEVRRIGSAEDFVSGGFHNLVYDLLVRTGAIGLVLFVVAFVLTVREGLWAWHRHPDRRVAALAGAAMVCLAGLLAKGMVESIFEKAKLLTLMGLLLGLMLSAGSSARARMKSAGPSAEAALELSRD